MRTGAAGPWVARRLFGGVQSQPVRCHPQFDTADQPWRPACSPSRPKDNRVLCSSSRRAQLNRATHRQQWLRDTRLCPVGGRCTCSTTPRDGRTRFVPFGACAAHAVWIVRCLRRCGMRDAHLCGLDISALFSSSRRW